MHLNANGDIRRPGEPDAYWWRRFFMLGGGLFALMLIAWLFSGGPGPSASRTAASKPSMAARQSRAGLPPAAGARCAASDVVLSLFTSQSGYGPAEQPRFDIYAVSTARGRCQMTYGPASVRVIVTWHGQVVWDSAACASPAAGTAWLERGVPRVLTITWNRGTTRSAGCAGSLSPNARGTFEAVAMAHGQTSPVRSFTLTASRAAPRPGRGGPLPPR